MLYSLVYDGLQSVGENLESVPNLANSCVPVPTSDPLMQASGEKFGSVWEYRLTRNATWHDGVPFTARDVIFTVNLQIGVNYSTMWAYQPYMRFITRADMIDNFTVRLHFTDGVYGSNPVAFGGALYFPIVAEHVLSSYTPSDLSFSWNGFPMIGTGPYGLEGVDVLSNSVTLLRNPYYHAIADRGVQARVDRIVLKTYDDDLSLYSALKIGRVQLAKFENQSAYRNVTSDISAGRVTGITSFVGLSPDQIRSNINICMHQNSKNPSRLDPIVRQAMAMGTNKSYILSNFYGGFGVEGTTLVSPIEAAWHYEPSAAEKAKLAYNLSAAAALLESNGYIEIDADSVRECTASSPSVQKGYVGVNEHMEYELLVSVDNPQDGNIASFLHNEWAQMGVNLVILNVTGEELMRIVFSYNFDLALSFSFCDPDPSQLLFTQSGLSWGGWNDNGYLNTSYDENYTSSISELNQNIREADVDICQRIHYLDIGYINLAYWYQMIAWRDGNFTGWGDWQSKPGRSICAHWSANPLLFSLSPANWITGEIKTLPDKHVSILVPTGWTFDRNFTVGTAFYDLGLNATSLGTYRAIAYMGTYAWSGKVTDERLAALANDIISELGTGFTLGYNVTSSPSPLTVDDEPAVEFTIKANAGPVFVIERVVILASSELGSAYALFLAAPESMYPSISMVFEEIVNSVTLEPIAAHELDLLILVGLVVAAVAVAAIVLVVLMLRKKNEAPPVPPSIGP